MAIPFGLAVMLIILLAGHGGSATPAAPDWPGLWGPFRNGTARGTLPDARRGVDMVWRRPTTGGYSEIVVQGADAFTMEPREADDFVISLDAATGRERWSVRVGPTFRRTGGLADGPISTPAVDGNDLFALGPHGTLLAADATTGVERWRVDLVQAFGAAAPEWGFAASPLVEGSLVIIATGGAASKGLIALDRATGGLVWHAAGTRQPAYTSAVAATIAGVRQIIAVSGDRVLGVAAENGRELWSRDGPGADMQVTNSALVLPGDRVLLTFWTEAVMLRIASGANGALLATEVWRSPRLRSSIGSTVYRDGYLYGFAGEQLIAMNADTAEIAWRERTGAGTVIAAGDRLALLGQESGELRIVRASPGGFSLLHRTRVFEREAMAPTGPSFAGGRLYLRSLKEIVALQ